MSMLKFSMPVRPNQSAASRKLQIWEQEEYEWKL